MKDRLENPSSYKESEIKEAQARILTTGLVDYAANHGTNPQDYSQEFYGFSNSRDK